MSSSVLATGGPARARHGRALLVLSQVFAEGGIQRFNRMFIAALDELGVRCDVLSFGDSEEGRRRWGAPVSASIQVFGRNKIAFSAAVARAIARADADDLLVIGHVSFLSLAAGSLAVSFTRHIRVLMIAHGIEIWSGMDDSLMKWAIAKVNHILCVSRYTRQQIELQRPEIKKDCCIVFPNALSGAWQQPAAPADRGRCVPGMPGSYILTVTRLDAGDRYKGVATLIETMGTLTDLDLHCVIAGDGDDRPYLEGMAERCGVADRVHFLGRVTDAVLTQLYSECVAFVLPSGKEGFGIVFLEAMHVGAPVIAAAERGAVDVVEHEHTGLLVRYGDVVALEKSIRRLLADPTLRDRLIRNGRVLVGNGGPFSFPAFVDRLRSVLELPNPHAQSALRETAVQPMGDPLTGSRTHRS